MYLNLLDNYAYANSFGQMYGTNLGQVLLDGQNSHAPKIAAHSASNSVFGILVFKDLNHVGRWVHFDPHMKKASPRQGGVIGNHQKSTTTPTVGP